MCPNSLKVFPRATFFRVGVNVENSKSIIKNFENWENGSIRIEVNFWKLKAILNPSWIRSLSPNQIIFKFWDFWRKRITQIKSFLNLTHLYWEKFQAENEFYAKIRHMLVILTIYATACNCYILRMKNIYDFFTSLKNKNVGKFLKKWVTI